MSSCNLLILMSFEKNAAKINQSGAFSLLFGYLFLKLSQLLAELPNTVM